MASAPGGEPRPIMRWKTTEPQDCPKQDDSDWRILCININNFPSEKNGLEKMKHDLLKATLVSSDADVMGISEVGRNESKMDLSNRPSRIVKSWFENGMAISTWNNDSISTYEPGGSMIISYSSHHQKRD